MPSDTGSQRMGRMLLAVLYFGASVLDHSVGYLWQANLPGGDNQPQDDGANCTDNMSGEGFNCSSGADAGPGRNGTFSRDKPWSFGWWRIRGTAEYIFGRGGVASDDEILQDHESWFSTPEGTGRLGRDAGWIGYFVDSVGVAAFGAWWCYAAWTGIGAGAIILLGLLAYSIQTLLAPVRWVTTVVGYAWGPLSCCCRRAGDEPAPLPEGPPLARNVEWRGPATGWPAETRYLQEKVKGRGSRRRLNDVLIRVHGQVARLQQDESSQRRIDTHGLKVKFLGITGCTSRQFRRELEDIGEIHLCRQVECGVEHGMHVKEYAGIDREALLDLHQYANGSPRWLLGVICRCFWRGGSVLLVCLRCLCCCGGTRRSRQLRRPDGGVRDLGPDSESEAEIDECSCQAVRVGVIQDGHMRPLSPHGCGDLACSEETILLDEDAAVSDIRPPAPGQNGTVSLCTHHRQLYLSASAKRKCGVLICYKAAKGARHGVPLCFDHLEEHGGGAVARRDSPHFKGLFNGFRRRFGRRDVEATRSRSPGDAVARPGRDRKAPEPPAGGAREEPKTPPRRVPRPQSAGPDGGGIPSPPKSPPFEEAVGRPLWVKCNCKGVQGDARQWIQVLGRVTRENFQVRGARRLVVRLDYFRSSVAVDPEMIDRQGPDGEEAYIRKLLKEVPEECHALGLDVKCYWVEDSQVARLRAWEGRRVADGKKIEDGARKDLEANFPQRIRKHAQGCCESEVWPTYPAEADLGIDRQVRGRESRISQAVVDKPRSRSRSHSLARAMREEEEERLRRAVDQGADTKAEEVDNPDVKQLLDTYEVACQSGQNGAEALGTLEMIYEIGEEALQKALGRFMKEPAGQRDAHYTDLCLQALHGLRTRGAIPVQDAEEVRRLASDRIAARQKSEVTVPRRIQEADNPATTEAYRYPPGLGGDALFAKPEDRGALVKPAGGEGRANPLLQGDALVAQLFGGSDRARRQSEEGTVKAGAVQGAGGEAEVGARMIHVLEGIKKATEGDRRTSPGTKSYIGSEEALDLYLARGCNTLTVEVCPDTTGKDLFDSLKRACGHSKHLLQSIGWPCLITNGIAYGLAAMCHGGRDHTTLPNWSLSVAQAVTATPKDFDHYEMPRDDKARHPTHFATWLKQARNEIKMIGSVLGLEHRSGRLKALEQIEQAHEADPEAWPEAYCYSLWEELKAAWVEELREGRRKLCKLLNCEQPRKEDLRFVALAPGSGFTFPTTFELDDPQGYYQKVCVPRQQRAIKSIIFGQLHHKRQAPGKVGENPGNEKGGEEIGDSRIGRAKGAKPDNPKTSAKAYPAGKRLRPKEAADSIRHGPKTKEGKPICWDSACHSGCQREACTHAHVPINGTRGLHWTVVAQLIRRGGLKSGPIIQPGQVDGRIAQLRTQAKQEQGEKVAEGSKQGGGDKQGWLPPEEYDLQYTTLEDDLRELTRGPDHRWLEDAGPGPAQTKEWAQPITHPEALKRQEKLQELEEAGLFRGLEEASDYLQSHVRGRVLNDALEGKETSVEEVLLEASSRGCKELAEEATQELQKRGRVGREDHPHSAWVGPPTWDDNAGYGIGRFQFVCAGRSYDWEYIDYKDTVPAGDQIASAIGLQPGELEERQCLLLHPAAGVLTWEGGDDDGGKPRLPRYGVWRRR